MGQTNLISFHQAQTLSGLFDCRVERSPDQRAYRFYRSETDCWDDLTWAQVRDRAALWQRAMQADGLEAGDRVAVMLNNCLEWVLFDLAATGLELVTVPLYVNDRQENFSYILQSTQSRLLLTDGIEQWQRIEEVGDQLDSVERIVTLQTVCEVDCDPRLRQIDDWLPDSAGDCYRVARCASESLATIVFTSGTTGPQKGDAEPQEYPF